MTTLESAQRRALRARAHHLEPVVAIGQQGLTPAVLHEIDVALLAHELVKVRVHNESRAEREAMLAEITAKLDCAPVQHLGKLLILWRENKDKPAAAAPAATSRPSVRPATRPGAPPGAEALRRRTRPGQDGSGNALPYFSRRGAGRFVAATPNTPTIRKRGRGG
ncbi:MAG TPA: YhbY family RNA-binding protein [Casimicrobiaceae bacterium]|jgi:putative YhbY family RNA-binding protein|nr:YhbY family RNA-binding protein [Casimicrobiaceae bacterium]